MKLGRRHFGPASCWLGYSEALPPGMRGRIIELTALEVLADCRGQGNARALLTLICAEADRARLMLMLHPAPYETEAGDLPTMTAGELAAWYERGFAFTTIQTAPAVLMARMPRIRPAPHLNPITEGIRAPHHP